MGLAQGPLRECNLVRLFCARRSTVIFSKYSPELVRVGKRQKGRWLSMNVEEGDWGQRQNYSLQVRTLRMNHTHPTYFNVDWLDDCCSQFQGRSILQMPYRCPPRGGGWGELEGLGIGRAIHQQQQYQQSVKWRLPCFINQESTSINKLSTTNTNRLIISIDKQLLSHNPVLSDSFEWNTEEDEIEFTVYLKLTHHKFVFVWYFWEL